MGEARADRTPGTETSEPGANPHWRRNLAVCVAGSFTTIVAMTLLVPYLPLYVRELGVTDDAAVMRWSGVAYGATFLTAALAAPVWGALGDRYGRKPMLVRASLGMAVAMSLLGLAENVYQLVGLRLLVGLLGGYASGSTILVAAQTPRRHSAWALGVLSAGIMGGNVAGPLLGGVLPETIGARRSFLLTGGLIFLAFLATVLLLREDRPARPTSRAGGPVPGDGAHRLPAAAYRLLVTGMLVLFATMSIEPLVTLFVAELGGPSGAATWSGVVMALGALGSILAAPRVGRLADRVGTRPVIVTCLVGSAVSVLLQAVAPDVVVLAALRLVMGAFLGGLLPAVTSALRHVVPDDRVGRVLGYGVSAQYAGQVLGPLVGGVLGGAFGMRSAFVGTALVLGLAAVVNVTAPRTSAVASEPVSSR